MIPAKPPSMILDKDPSKPGEKTSLKFLGYWHAVKIDPKTMQVVSHDDYCYDRYEKDLGKGYLPLPSDYVDTTWNADERAKVVSYLKQGKPYEYWRGYSGCRFGCDHKAGEQGSRDLTDGTYVWPEGFPHYVERHGVRPPQEFINHVLSK